MRILSRSGYEASLRCQREYYWRFLYQRAGLEETVKPTHLAIGLALHRGMEEAMKPVVRGMYSLYEDLAEVGLESALQEWDSLSRGHEALDDEVRALLEALLRGWWLTQAPRFLSEWEIVSVEEEGKPITIAPDVGLAFRADLVGRNRHDGVLAVVNWKTTSSSFGFSEQFESDIQMWTEAECVERTLGEPVVGAIAEGFVKGSLRDGHFSSPLVRPWRALRADGTKVYTWDYKSTQKEKGLGLKWERINAWEETFPTGERGVAAWLKWMPPEAVAAHFVSSGFLKRPPQEVMRHWLERQMAQRAMNEEAALAPGVPEEDRLAFFAQHFSKWTCGSREAPRCPFRSVCFGEATLEELVKEGTLEKRVDHHGR